MPAKKISIFGYCNKPGSMFRTVLIICLLLCLGSCKKESSSNGRSPVLELLQQAWNHQSTTYNSPFGIITQASHPPVINEFKTDGNLYVSGPVPTVYKYILLNDNSTLLVENKFVSPLTYDTNVISVITNNQLVYRRLNPPPPYISIVHSLYR
jgi:hypothetical protein